MRETDPTPSKVISSPGSYRAERSFTDNEKQQDRTPCPGSQGQGKEKRNRSPGTVQTYYIRVRPFIEHFFADCFPSVSCSRSWSVLPPQEWTAFPRWFADKYRNAPWFRQTLKIVKLSLCYVFENYLDKNGLQEIRNFMPVVLKEKGSMCMALHEKNPEISQIQGILAWLDSQKTLLAGLAAAWFRAEMVTGLRTKEWRHASYREKDTGGTVSIINGKQNDMLSQGSGAVRHLVYSGPEHEASRRILRKFFLMKDEYFRQFIQEKGYTEEKCFARMQRNCQKMYRRANQILRKGRPVSTQEKNITLYSLRDAFKADAFSLMNADPERRRDIAALLGHSSLFSQDMYVPENRTLGRNSMPAVSGRDEKNTRHTLPQTDSRTTEDTYEQRINRLPEAPASFGTARAPRP